MNTFTGRFGLFLLLTSSTIRLGAAMVTVCDEASLRAAVNGGGTVTIGCDGTILLTSTIVISQDTVLDATGRQVVISGGASVRAFEVAADVKAVLRGLSVVHGVDEKGAGIYNMGHLTLDAVVLSNNVARSDSTTAPLPPHAKGGAIYNAEGGTVLISNTTFLVNQSVGASPGSLDGLSGYDAYGGAIYNLGQLEIAGSVFEGNVALGGAGSSNSVARAAGGSGGHASGGAVFSATPVRVRLTAFRNNLSRGGNGGRGGPGDFNQMSGASSGGAGGSAGSASAGAIQESGGSSIQNCSFVGNKAQGGNGGEGGAGISVGAPYASGAGGPGGPGGSAVGGAVIHADGVASLFGNTYAANEAIGGTGGPGHSGANSPAATPGH